jgi:hypothetical protein
MDKLQFRELFISNAQKALKFAEKKFGIYIDENFDVELHGGGLAGEKISIDQCVDNLYLGNDRFFRVIDIGVKSIKGNKALLFVRISAHQPVKFEETWNTPSGNGPFKVIEPIRIGMKG